MRVQLLVLFFLVFGLFGFNRYVEVAPPPVLKTLTLWVYQNERQTFAAKLENSVEDFFLRNPTLHPVLEDYVRVTLLDDSGNVWDSVEPDCVLGLNANDLFEGHWGSLETAMTAWPRSYHPDGANRSGLRSVKIEFFVQ